MGFFTSISGGGGVFGIPAMIALGISPIHAITLNKISDLGVIFGSFKNYLKSNSIDWKLGIIAIFPMIIGSYLGIQYILQASSDNLQLIIIAGLLIGIFFILKPINLQKQKSKTFFIPGLILLFLLGIWEGVLAMAGGTFFIIILIYCFQKDFLQAKSTHIVATAPETIFAAFLLFIASDISLQYAFTMFLASFCGAWIGSHLTVKNGNNFIKYTMVTIIIVMLIIILLF
jgi:uncharacterized protein